MALVVLQFTLPVLGFMMILEDKDPSYRVLDLSVNVFNDSHPSYWHKNIGGYSPASYSRGEALSRACSIILLLIVLAAAAVALLKK